jgi:hypothetical protein
MKVQWRSVMASVAEISAYLAKEKSMWKLLMANGVMAKRNDGRNVEKLMAKAWRKYRKQ